MSLGEMLQQARQARRITFNQAALETRIRQTLLEALEQNEYGVLPPRPFMRGLLRNYALYLNLDPDSILEIYDIEAGHKAPSPVPPPPPASQSDQINEPPGTLRTNTEPEQTPFAFPPFQLPSSPKTNGTQVTSQVPVETIFRVAPETEAEVAEPNQPLNLPQEPPTLAQKIGSTRIPEVVAILALAVALFGLVSVGFDGVQRLTNPLLSPPTDRPTTTTSPTIPPGSTPTGIPTLAQTLAASTSASLFAPATGQSDTSGEAGTGTASLTATAEVPADAKMTIAVQAVGQTHVLVLADEEQVFDGTLQKETRTWTAHLRFYLSINNLGQGSLLFNGKRILPRNQQERTTLVRAWLMSPLGTPVAVPPTPYPATVGPSPTPTDTFTVTPTRTATDTATPRPSATPTASRTFTSTRTPTKTPTPTRTATFTVTWTSTPTPTQTPTPTRCPKPILDCQ
jgi:cytoskeletal protein RodZ